MRRAWLTVLLVGFVLRAAFLFVPPDLNWRECQTAMQTRDLPRSGWDWLHPKMDWGGPHPVTVIMEFPLFNLIWAGADATTGAEHRLLTGRLLALVAGMANLLLVGWIGRRLGSERVGLLAAAIYAACPLAWHLEATGTPEPLWQSAILLAFASTLRWAEKPAPLAAAAALASLSLAMAIKLPQGASLGAAIFGVWLLERRRRGLPLATPQVLLWGLPLLAAAAWYRHMDAANRAAGSIWDFDMSTRFLLGTWSQRFSPHTTLRFCSRFLVYGGPVWLLFGAHGAIRLAARLAGRSGTASGGSDGISRSGALALLLPAAAALAFQYAVVNGCFIHKHYQYPASAPFAWVAAWAAASALARWSVSRQLLLVLGLQFAWSLPVMSRLWRDMDSPLVRRAVAEVLEKTLPDEPLAILSRIPNFVNPASPFVHYLADRRGLNFNALDHPPPSDPALRDRGMARVLELDGDPRTGSFTLRSLAPSAASPSRSERGQPAPH